MNNLLNSKILELLGGLDKSKIDQASKLLNNMSKEDLNNLVGMLNRTSNTNQEKK